MKFWEYPIKLINDNISDNINDNIKNNKNKDEKSIENVIIKKIENIKINEKKISPLIKWSGGKSDEIKLFEK